MWGHVKGQGDLAVLELLGKAWLTASQPLCSCPSTATTDEDEEGKLTEDIMKLLEQTGWQPTNVDGKGYLLNEPGAQPPSFYGDFSCKEEPEVDRPGGFIGLIASDLKNMDNSWLDSLLTPVRLPSIQAIPCAP